MEAQNTSMETSRSSERATRLPARLRDDNIVITLPSSQRRERERERQTDNGPAPAPASALVSVSNLAPAPARKPAFRIIFRHPPPPAEPVAEACSSSIDWWTVQRQILPGEERSVELDGRYYPWNEWGLLRPGMVLALLKAMSTYFTLSDSFQLLHLKRSEIAEIERLLDEENRRDIFDIHEDDVRYAKRVLLANVESGKLVADLGRRLDEYAGVTTSMLEIENGLFEMPEDRSVVDYPAGEGKEGRATTTADEPSDDQWLSEVSWGSNSL